MSNEERKEAESLEKAGLCLTKITAGMRVIRRKNTKSEGGAIKFQSTQQGPERGGEIEIGFLIQILQGLQDEVKKFSASRSKISGFSLRNPKRSRVGTGSKR